MNNVKLTVKNYRCFEDQTPVRVELGPGFCAFVGQNNSGKSTLVKLFYELRDLFSYIGPNGNLLGLLQGRDQGVNALGAYDQGDIFSNRNNRGIELQVDLSPNGSSKGSPITRVRFLCSRSNPNNWRATFFHGSDCQKISSSEVQYSGFSVSEGRDFLHLNNSPIFDWTELFHFTRSFVKSIYIGPFRNVLNQGSANYYDIQVGDQFVKLWHQWQAGNVTAQNIAISRVIDDIRHIFGFKTLGITATPDGKTLHLTIDNHPHKLDQLGAGLTQFIVVLANAMVRAPDYILIDEPELNLHPALQIDFLTTLASYAQQGILFATHSLGLARSVAERIYTFQRKAGMVTVTPFEQTHNYPEFLGEMSFSGFKELGFDQILLVEGVHDVKTAHQFLRKLGKDHQVVVLPLGGDQLARGGVEIELAEMKRLSNNVFALVDSERHSASAPADAKREQFRATCETLGFKVCITQRRAIENYFSDQAIKKAKGQAYSALSHYQALGEAPLAWDKSENWRIAREMDLSEVEATDVGNFFKSI